MAISLKEGTDHRRSNFDLSVEEDRNKREGKEKKRHIKNLAHAFSFMMV